MFFKFTLMKASTYSPSYRNAFPKYQRIKSSITGDDCFVAVSIEMSLPVALGTERFHFQSSKQYHMNTVLNSIHLNGHTLGIHSRN